MNFTWRPNLLELPEGPGVYLFCNARGAILYVGKASSLRRRIGSYFHHRRQQPAKLRRMITRTRAVTIHETESELQALLLESRLIKQEKPPYNQLSRFYASLPFVKLTLNEPFPRLILTHAFLPDGGQYLGPFPRFEMAAAVWAALQRLFPLRSCETPIRPGIFPRPCEAYQVRKCAGPCVGRQSASTYQQHVDELLDLLARGHQAITERLRLECQRAADSLFFERAGHLHTLLTRLNEAAVGRPLAFLPVALRNIVVILAGPLPHRHDIVCVRRGLFAGSWVAGEGRGSRQGLTAFLGRCFTAANDAPRSTEAAVDELRLVAGWLQRTRSQARWVHIEPWMSAPAVVDAVLRALPEGASSLP